MQTIASIITFFIVLAKCDIFTFSHKSFMRPADVSLDFVDIQAALSLSLAGHVSKQGFLTRLVIFSYPDHTSVFASFVSRKSIESESTLADWSKSVFTFLFYFIFRRGQDLATTVILSVIDFHVLPMIDIRNVSLCQQVAKT